MAVPLMLGMFHFRAHGDAKLVVCGIQSVLSPQGEDPGVRRAPLQPRFWPLSLVRLEPPWPPNGSALSRKTVADADAETQLFSGK